MPTVLPQPTTPQPLPSAGTATPVATVPDAPPALLQLPPASLVRAEIVQTLAHGLLLAQTEFGTVQLRTNVPLQGGAKIDLQVLRTSPQLQVALRPAEGAGQGQLARNASLATNQTGGDAIARAGAFPTPIQSANVSLPSLAVGVVIRATLAAPAGASGPQIKASPEARSEPAATTPSAPIPLGQRMPRPGTPMEVQVRALVPAGQPLPAAGAARSDLVTGVVTAFTPHGRPVLQTPLGLMTLEALPDNVRVGSQIQIDVMPSAPPRPAATLSTSFPETFVQTRRWPALEEVFSHLAQRSVGDPPPQQPLPQANRQLGANIMLILGALRIGDIRTWLGESATILENERPELAARANDEFAQLARTFNETSPNDWRTAILPFFNGGHLAPVQMHLRGGKSEKGDGRQAEGSRFIIDIELSRLGRIQLDGFIKKQSGDKKGFDLIVRTDQPLPHLMRRDIHDIFSSFGEAAGLSGAITFQARARFVDVALPRLAQRADHGLIV